MSYPVEKYYAIRIGDPRYDSAYLMIRGDDDMTPWLFNSREEAEAEIPKQPATRVVRVVVKQGTK